MNLSYLQTAAPVGVASDETMATERPFLIAFPVIIVSICILVGFAGNCLVLYVYKRRWNESTYCIFILCLALFDCVECGIGMPFMIANQFSVSSNAACKGFSFVQYFVSIGSGLMLVIIAFERYRRVCKPSYHQISPATGKLLALVITTISLSLSWPALLLYEYDTIVLENFSEGTCHIYTELLSGSVYPVVYYAILAMTWLIGYNIVTTFYVMIWRQMKTQHDIRRKTLSVRMSKKSETGQNKTHDSSAKNKHVARWDVQIFEVQETYLDSNNIQLPGRKLLGNAQDRKTWRVSECQTLPKQTKSSVTNSEKYSSQRSLPSTNEHVQKPPLQNLTEGESSVELTNKTSKDFLKPETKHNMSSGQSEWDRLMKITKIMFVIALVNMVSYIPHIAISILTFANPDRVYTGTEEVFYFQILSRSFMINSVVNPFIYGVMDQKFRLECKKLKSRWQQRIKLIKFPFMRNK
ncbi:hypothetical protein ACJMK2_037836 [Sinanodonta woodiana]|uniref:G-protein coupled receptors family 1 profile domain-containing protein n=1 Tax=Sinanodonta woodiana TaxID=1069815 RepID=A0ABD3WLN4_SINWO